MKFTVSSSALLGVLATTGKVINTKNTLPILDYFLMELKDGVLKVTASDLETTLVSTLKVDNVEEDGVVAAPSKLMLDVLKVCSEMPLDIEVNPENFEIKISWFTGASSVPGANPVSYPQLQTLDAERTEISLDVDVLINGINKAIFATADDELRPVMNGIYINLDPQSVTFVATDAHKLVKYAAQTSQAAQAAFILPKKPANLLKTMLLKESSDVNLSFDQKNAVFTLSNSMLICHLIEGTYPNYNAVIPSANPNKVLVDRKQLLDAIKRVAVCANPTTNLIKLSIADNTMELNAQDNDFYVSSNEKVTCSYDGVPVSIGFKASFFVEILQNIETPSVHIELADSTRAGVLRPVYDDVQTDDVLMLLMPMMMNN